MATTRANVASAGRYCGMGAKSSLVMAYEHQGRFFWTADQMTPLVPTHQPALLIWNDEVQGTQHKGHHTVYRCLRERLPAEDNGSRCSAAEHTARVRGCSAQGQLDCAAQGNWTVLNLCNGLL